MCKNLHWKFWKSKVHWMEKQRKFIYVWNCDEFSFYWQLYPSVGLHLFCGACMRTQHQVKPKPCLALCTVFGSGPLHIARGPLLGYGKLEVMPLVHVLETFGSLRVRDFISQGFVLAICRVCYRCRRVSAGQPAILRWERSWKAKVSMYFAHACLRYH